MMRRKSSRSKHYVYVLRQSSPTTLWFLYMILKINYLAMIDQTRQKDRQTVKYINRLPYGTTVLA